MADPLRMLLDLPEQEKSERGLEHTPREIWQQPDHLEENIRALPGSALRVERCFAASRNRPRQHFLAHRISGRRWHVRLYGPGVGSIAAPAMELRSLGDSQHDAADRIRRLSPSGKRISVDFVFALGRESGGRGAAGAGADRHREIRHLVITCNQKGRWHDCARATCGSRFRSGAGRCGERPRGGHDQFVHQHGSRRAVRWTFGRECAVRRNGRANVRDRTAVSAARRRGCGCHYNAGLHARLFCRFGSAASGSGRIRAESSGTQRRAK